jgi:hypothetical protein
MSQVGLNLYVSRYYLILYIATYKFKQISSILLWMDGVLDTADACFVSQLRQSNNGVPQPVDSSAWNTKRASL